MIQKILFVVFIFIFSACATVSVKRINLIDNMPELTAIEMRAGALLNVVGALQSQGMLAGQKADEVKRHYDIYYIYHIAASVDLAKGNPEFSDSMKRAQEALDKMEITLLSLAKNTNLQRGM
jgi:hypothetical protein